MTTEEAFEQLINHKGSHKILNITARQLAVVRFNYRKGAISRDKMEALLLEAGWVKVPEYWQMPKEKN